jgi:hypothetical protein
MPSFEYAIPAPPTATHTLPFQAIHVTDDNPEAIGPLHVEVVGSVDE